MGTDPGKVNGGQRHEEPVIRSSTAGPQWSDETRKEIGRETMAEEHTTTTTRRSTLEADGRSSREIERDIEHTRADMDETVEAIRARLQPERLMQYALDGVVEAIRGDSGKKAMRLIKENPVPTALTALGIGWMVYNNSERMQAGGHALREQAQYRMAQAGEKASDAAYRSGGEASHKYESAKLRAGESASSMGDRMREKAHDTRDRIGEKAHDARDRIGEKAHDAREGLSHAAGRARQKTRMTAARARANTRHRAAQAGDQLNQTYQDHPFAMGMMAMALSAATAILLPSTRREDELMGGVRDEALDSAKARARETGEAVVESARPHAERAMDETAHHVREAVEDVKKHASELRHDLEEETRGAKEDVREELKHQGEKTKHQAEEAKEQAKSTVQGAGSTTSSSSASTPGAGGSFTAPESRSTPTTSLGETRHNPEEEVRRERMAQGESAETGGLGTEGESIPRSETRPGNFSPGSAGYTGSSSTFTNPSESRSDADPLEDR